MHAPLVYINTADAGELARLYGIGPELSRRIVEHRHANGPFATPDDLARVEGVSAELARTLAPHIDWRVSENIAKKEQEREWGLAALSVIAILAFIWVNRDILSDKFYDLLQAWNRREPFALGWLVAQILRLSAALSLVFISVSSIFAAFTRDKARQNRLHRATFRGLIPFVLATVALAITYAIYYQFYASRGWKDVLSDSGEMVSLILSIVWLMISLVLIALIWRPALAYNAYIARGFDIALLLVAFTQIVLVWFVWQEWSVFNSVFLGFTGLILAACGYVAIRIRVPILSAVVETFLSSPSDRRKANTSAWMGWLNSRLPNPEEQKALQQALDETYPPSRTRTLIGIIIFGAGGWLIITALGAIVEWVVQGWLGNLIR